jgi:hypothetical protein
LLDIVRGKALGSVSAAGNVLSLDGAMVRRGLMGENPLMPLLSPISGEHHRSGRDLLRHYGLIGRKDTWANFLPGLAADIVTDPVSWLLPAKSALTKGGQLAAKSGLMKDVTRGALTQAGKQMGKAQSRLLRSADDIIKALPATEQAGALARFQAAGKLSGLSDDAIKSAMTEVVGKQGAFALPFSRTPIATFGGSGPMAQGWARGKDIVGEAIMSSGPMRGFRSVFAGVRGTLSKQVQRTAERLHRMEDMQQSTWRRAWSDATEPVVQTDMLDPKYNAMVRGLQEVPEEYAEEVVRTISQQTGKSPDALRAIRAKYKQSTGEFADSMTQSTSKFTALDDPFSEHVSRHTGDMAPQFRGTGREFDASTPEQIARKESLRGFPGAPDDYYSPTNTLTRLSRETANKTRKQMVEHLEDSWIGRPDIRQYYTRENKAIVDDLTAQIAETDDALRQLQATNESAQRVLQSNPTQQAADAAEAAQRQWDTAGEALQSQRTGLQTRLSGIPLRDRVEDIADVFESLPKDLRQIGIFPNHPMADAYRMFEHGGKSMARSEWIADTLGAPDVFVKEGGVPLQTIAKELKLDYGTTAQRIADKLSLDPVYVSKLSVDSKVAADLVQATQKFDMPKSVSEVVRLWDSVANAIKAGQTSPWPAFHTRDYTGSAFASMLDNTFGLKSRSAVWDLQRGKFNPYWAKHPLWKAEAARRGIPKPTEKQWMEMAGDMLWRHNTAPFHAGEHLAQVGAGTQTAAPKQIGDILGQRMGSDPHGFGRVAKQFAGMEGDATWKLFGKGRGTVRGVGGAQRSTLAPFAAGDTAGALIEQMNRASAWLELTARGVDPNTATDMVRLSQVDYAARAYSPAVRDVVLRMVPYGKFQIGMLKKLGHELTSYPGGPHAIAIKTAGGLARPDELVPPYVSQQMAAKIGETPEGDRRYLTGLGLMHEPAVAYFQPDTKQLGLHVMSQLSPMIKGPGEWFTGQTWFQQGPMGGRAIEDLDPAVGRAMSNAMVSMGLRKREGAMPVQWAGPATRPLEHAIAQSPFGRLATTARTIFDPRKTKTEKALNTLTGVRTTTVSPQAQDAMVRDLLATEVRRHPAGRLFITPYFSEMEKANLSPEDMAQVERMEALRELLIKRSKERAKKRGR